MSAIVAIDKLRGPYRMASETKRVPLQEYRAERSGLLSDSQIAHYIDELSIDDRVLAALLVSADREAIMSLTPQEQIDNAHVTSGHAVNFLRRHKLPDRGLQDLQQAQHMFATVKLKEGKTSSLNWFQRLYRRD